MSQAIISNTSYLLLNVVDLLLDILSYVGQFILHVLKTIVQHLLNLNMLEQSKKRKKHKEKGKPVDVTVKRGVIDVNWQLLLSSTLMEKKEVKQQKPENRTNYTGTFRRARIKKYKEFNENVKKLEILNINKVPFVTKNGKKEINVEDDEKKDQGSEKQRQITKFLAMDCEMVGIGDQGNDHMLARVSIVNKFGDCVYDKFVKPREEVVDYRTSISGIRKEDLINGEDFATVQKEVSELLKGKILVGHSLKNDLSVLFLSHPKNNIRDTSRYKPFRTITKGSTPSLKRLAKEILGIDIQHGEHSSVEDAKAVMQLYCTVARSWERDLSQKAGYSRKFIEV
ncbi:RNA exonuclease 4-like [Melitaea cinxia]|uniref:RNA exonuclease 4-like n=1 Tax=Melitaea cinxia TaxID=113334 RepID=UPI001E27244A|nr:RNA exonuclease 4-like [Melitaea cinxia]